MLAGVMCWPSSVEIGHRKRAGRRLP
jgi:hypothetical protein